MLKVTVVTVRDIFQSEVAEINRFGEDYKRMSALILLDKSDAEREGIRDGSNVVVESDNGKVVVVAKLSEDPHPGLAFMPNSPWSNRIIPAETDDTKIPNFKNVVARITVSNENVPDIEDLLREIVT